MRKIFVLFLAAVLTFILVACGSSGSAASANSAGESAAQAPAETSAEQAVQTTAPSFTEQAIVDNEYCTVILKDINEEDTWGYSWDVYLENKTDKTLMFSMENTSVNGFMCDPFWAEEVAPGKKANTSITWMTSSLETNGIDPHAVTAVTFDLNVYDSEDWLADRFVEETFTVYPMGEEMATAALRESQAGDIVLFDTEQCSMTVTGVVPDSMWGYEVSVYLVNKTDQNLMFSVNNASINGFMCDPFWASEVAAGKSANTTITWMSSTLEEAGIDISAITEIELPISVYPSEDYTAGNVIDGTYTIALN